MNEVSKNKEAIKENRKRIFKLDAEVMTNKTMIYASRSMVLPSGLKLLCKRC